MLVAAGRSEAQHTLVKLLCVVDFLYPNCGYCLIVAKHLVFSCLLVISFLTSPQTLELRRKGIEFCREPSNQEFISTDQSLIQERLKAGAQFVTALENRRGDPRLRAES